MPESNPKLSLLILWPEALDQLPCSLFTLTLPYQYGITEADYEIVIIGGNDNHDLDTAKMLALPNVHFHKIEAPSNWLRHGIDAGLKYCRGDYLGIFAGNPLFVTPRLLKYSLMAARSSDRSLITVPDYEIDLKESCNRDFLNSTHWHSSGYELFRQAKYSATGDSGFLSTTKGSKLYFCRKNLFSQSHVALNETEEVSWRTLSHQYFYQIARQKMDEFYLLPGEGSFLPTLTGEGIATNTLVSADINARPTLLGPVGRFALPFLQRSVLALQESN
ncbi:MAG: hypothetical protein JKY98_04835 [Gammaproteobacteria bacterium]|nr:hypothetical protein [Gammaproteobacteria bacterium]